MQNRNSFARFLGRIFKAEETIDLKSNNASDDVTNTSSTAVIMTVFSNDEYDYAGFWVRLVARLLDGIVFCLMFPFVLFVAGVIAYFTGLSLFDNLVFNVSVIGVCSYIVYTLYIALFTYQKGQTPGKRMFGLQVVGLNGKHLSFGMAFYREFVGTILMIGLFCLPAIPIIFHKQHIGFGDYLVDSRVIKAESLKASLRQKLDDDEYAAFLLWKQSK